MGTVVAEGKTEGEADQLMTPQRVNRYMAWLRHVLNGVVREGKLPNNPVLKLKMYKEPKGKTRFLSMEEERTCWRNWSGFTGLGHGWRS